MILVRRMMLAHCKRAGWHKSFAYRGYWWWDCTRPIRWWPKTPYHLKGRA